MARGQFDVTGVPIGWVDLTAGSLGWFDPDLLDIVAAVAVEVKPRRIRVVSQVAMRRGVNVPPSTQLRPPQLPPPVNEVFGRLLVVRRANDRTRYASPALSTFLRPPAAVQVAQVLARLVVVRQVDRTRRGVPLGTFLRPPVSKGQVLARIRTYLQANDRRSRNAPSSTFLRPVVLSVGPPGKIRTLLQAINRSNRRDLPPNTRLLSVPLSPTLSALILRKGGD